MGPRSVLRCGTAHREARDVPRDRRVPAVCALDLNLGDNALDRVKHLGWHLLHAMRVAGVAVDVLEQPLLGLIPRHPLVAGHDITTPELLHETLLAVLVAAESSRGQLPPSSGGTHGRVRAD